MPKTPETEYTVPAVISPNGVGPADYPEQAAYDPTDLSKLRSKKGVKGLRTRQPQVPIVNRPGDGEFFRVRPGAGYFDEIDLLVVNTNSTSTDRQSVHIITDEARGLPVVEKFVKCCRLRMGVYRNKVVFLWYRPISDNTWTESCWEAQEQAETSWVTLESDSDRKQYLVHYAEDDQKWGEPEWPDISLQELFTHAFQGRIITSVDDPVLLKIRGRDSV